MCAGAHDMGNPLSKAIRFDAIGDTSTHPLWQGEMGECESQSPTHASSDHSPEPSCDGDMS